MESFFLAPSSRWVWWLLGGGGWGFVGLFVFLFFVFFGGGGVLGFGGFLVLVGGGAETCFGLSPFSSSWDNLEILSLPRLPRPKRGSHSL